MRDPILENANISEGAKWSIESNNLSYDTPLSPAELQDSIDTLMRIESGETTYDQEKERLLKIISDRNAALAVTA